MTNLLRAFQVELVFLPDISFSIGCSRESASFAPDDWGVRELMYSNVKVSVLQLQLGFDGRPR